MASIDLGEKVEELMDSPAAPFVALMGYACAYLGVCGGFYTLYRIVTLYNR